MRKLVALILILAVVWAIPPLRARIGAASLPLLGRLGPAGDVVMNPVRRMQAKNKLSHTLQVMASDYNLGQQPPDSLGFHIWMRSRMNGETGIDPWGNSYWMKDTGPRLILGSSGPDGRPGTGDDVTETAQF